MPTPFEFVLYKHGPYSFDIENELEQMKSYAAIEVQPCTDFGVVLKPSDNASLVKKESPLLASEVESIQAIGQFVGSKNVTELERLATAVWVRGREHASDNRDVANRVHDLKPHISIADALAADAQITAAFTFGH